MCQNGLEARLRTLEEENRGLKEAASRNGKMLSESRRSSLPPSRPAPVESDNLDPKRQLGQALLTTPAIFLPIWVFRPIGKTARIGGERAKKDVRKWFFRMSIIGY